MWVQVPPSARGALSAASAADRSDRREILLHYAALIPWLDPAAIIGWAGPWALAVVEAPDAAFVGRQGAGECDAHPMIAAGSSQGMRAA